MPAAVLAIFQCAKELKGNIVLMSRLFRLFHLIPGANDQSKDGRNQMLLEEVVLISRIASDHAPSHVVRVRMVLAISSASLRAAVSAQNRCPRGLVIYRRFLSKTFRPRTSSKLP